MKFQAFHVNPGEKLKKKDVNNNTSNFMSVFPNDDDVKEYQVFYHFHKTKVKTDRFIKVYYQNIKIEFGVYFSKQKAF